MRSDWHRQGGTNSIVAHFLLCAAVLPILLFLPESLLADGPTGVMPLLPLRVTDLQARLHPDAHVLIEPAAIEEFLQELDGAPPDWSAVYSHGHHDPAHDERLFQLNRERDARRVGKEALCWRIAFAWSGELSTYDPESGGFRVVIGPRFTPTSWGLVRFKYEDLPGNLVAVPTLPQREALLQNIEQKQVIEIDVVMIGTLTPEESIVYDFSHDQEGLGLIMPVVRVEEVAFLLASTQQLP